MPTSSAPTPEQTAAELQELLGALYRRIRQTKQLGDLTLPETAALSQLGRSGPTTAAALAKLERISPQSIGTTLAALEAKGLVARAADPTDRRRVILSLTPAGEEVVHARRNARAEQLTRAVSTLTADELAKLAAALPVLSRIGEAL